MPRLSASERVIIMNGPFQAKSGGAPGHRAYQAVEACQPAARS
jgi:hypothetical protein